MYIKNMNKRSQQKKLYNTDWLHYNFIFIVQANVAELVDAPDLGSGAERCESSSLSIRTKY